MWYVDFEFGYRVSEGGTKGAGLCKMWLRRGGGTGSKKVE